MKKKDIILIAAALVLAAALYAVSQLTLGTQAAQVVVTVGNYVFSKLFVFKKGQSDQTS